MKLVIAFSANQFVISGTTRKMISPIPTIQGIISRSAKQLVIPGSANEVIITIFSIEFIISFFTAYNIITAFSVDNIIALATIDTIIAFSSFSQFSFNLISCQNTAISESDPAYAPFGIRKKLSHNPQFIRP